MALREETQIGIWGGGWGYNEKYGERHSVFGDDRLFISIRSWFMLWVEAGTNYDEHWKQFSLCKVFRVCEALLPSCFTFTDHSHPQNLLLPPILLSLSDLVCTDRLLVLHCYRNRQLASVSADQILQSVKSIATDSVDPLPQSFLDNEVNLAKGQGHRAWSSSTPRLSYCCSCSSSDILQWPRSLRDCRTSPYSPRQHQASGQFVNDSPSRSPCAAR